MRTNVGDNDRKIRLALGTILVAMGAAGYSGFLPVANMIPQALTSVILSATGIALLLTGYFRKCLVYRALGKGTAE